VTIAVDQDFEPRLRRRRIMGRVVAVSCGLLTLVGVVVLGVLLYSVVEKGWPGLSLNFLTRPPSTLNPQAGGIESALHGTFWLMLITLLVAVPVGVAAAVYLQEYARDTTLTRFIKLNIANLAGVPSIVYGILGLAVFVRAMSFDRSVLAGGLTLSLLVLPVIIIAAREALAAVPGSIRAAAFALGATRWQTVRAHVLPAALPGIMTGVILALSRAIGEAAPLLLIGGVVFVQHVPERVVDPFTALPIQIYSWSDAAQEVFHSLAASGIIVLVGVLLTMNAVAVLIRSRRQRHKTW
jgi:phosphate transport system permease protein